MTDVTKLDPKDSRRARGKLGKVWFGMDHDHRTHCFTAMVDDTTGTQGLQMLFDTEAQMRQFAVDFCAVFGTSDVERLKGKECFALRCFDIHNEGIEGIESIETGKRIVKTTWWREHVDPRCPSPLMTAVKSAEGTIRQLEWRIEEEKSRIVKFYTDYIGWE